MYWEEYKDTIEYSKVQVIKNIVTLHLNSRLAMGFASMPLFDLAKFLHLREFCNAQRIWILALLDEIKVRPETWCS